MVEGRLAWREGNDVYLIDPASLAVGVGIRSPDGAVAKRLVVSPELDRFLMISEQGGLSLWSWDGDLIAVSHPPIGEKNLFDTSYDLTWSSHRDRILLSTYEEGAVFWTLSAGELVCTRVVEGAGILGEFLPNEAGISLWDGCLRGLRSQGSLMPQTEGSSLTGRRLVVGTVESRMSSGSATCSCTPLVSV